MSSSSYNPNITLTSLSTQQGEINLVTNPIAQFDANNWTTSSATLTRSTTGVLSPVIPTGFTASSTTSTTSYVQTSLLNVPATLRNRKLKVQLYIQCADTATWKVDVLKSDGSTRYTLSTDASGVSALPALTGTYTTTFDMDTDSGIYVRLTRYAGSGTSTLSFTNLIVGPGIQPQGAVTQAWLSYSSGSTVLPAGLSTEFRRVGDSVEIRVVGVTTGTSSSQFVVGLPTGTTLSGSYAGNQPLPGTAEVEDAPSTGYVFHGVPCYATSTTFKIKVSDKVTNAYWGNTTPVNFAGVSGYRVMVTTTISISEWSGSGTVQLAQNDTEFASNDGSGGTAANTTYNTGMVYGPAGSNIVAVASVTGGYQRTKYKVSFQSAIQSTDQIRIEISSGAGWAPVEESYYRPGINGTGYAMGIQWSYNDASSIYVEFGNAGAYSSNATYDAAGTAWSTQTSTKWRVRKSSAGAAVGFGIVNSQSAGLLPVSNSNLDDATATRLGLKEYLHNTVYNNSTTLSVTSVQGGFAVDRAVFVPYQMQDSTWRIRFNIVAGFTSASISVITVVVSNVVFKNTTNFNQPASGFFANGTVRNVAYTSPNTGNLIVSAPSAETSTRVYLSGDVELESKPTWAY